MTMMRLPQSLYYWLFVNHKDVLPMILFGHIDLFTEEMNKEYIDWMNTDEGKSYLPGGSNYLLVVND